MLAEALSDLDAEVVPLAAVHMGGEEVHWGCWSTPAVEKWAVDTLKAEAEGGAKQGEATDRHQQEQSSQRASFEDDAGHVLYSRFQERLHKELLPSLSEMRWRRPIVWEDVLFEAPSWAKARLQQPRENAIVEVFKRPRWDRMSLYNATALGYDSLFTNGESH